MEEIHLAALFITVPFILYADHLGFLYFIGKKQTLPAKTNKILHTAVFIGLFALMITGFLMVRDNLDFYLNYGPMQIKLAFVGVLFLNGLFITGLMQTATKKSFKQLSIFQKLVLLISGGLSATGWIGAAIIGFEFL